MEIAVAEADLTCGFEFSVGDRDHKYFPEVGPIPLLRAENLAEYLANSFNNSF